MRSRTRKKKKLVKVKVPAHWRHITYVTHRGRRVKYRVRIKEYEYYRRAKR